MNFIFDPSLVLYLPLYELNSSSFMSNDAYGHLCTVTGASWRADGHYFDGVDDIVDCNNAPALKPGSAITVEAWLKNHDATNNVELVNYRINANPYSLYVLKDNDCFVTLTDGTRPDSYYDSVLPDEWKHVVMTFSRAALKLRSYIDSIPQGQATTNDLDMWVDHPNLDKLYIGAAKAGTRHANCSVGEVRIYNRALTRQEIQHNYLATKWRYQ